MNNHPPARMRAPYEVFIGLRYVMSKRSNQFISFISLISILSIALGVIVLTTVLSIVNGFERALTEHLIGMETDATLIAYDDSLANWRFAATRLVKHPEVEAAAPYLQSEAMVTFGDKAKGVIVRGIVPEEESKITFVAQRIIEGDFDSLAPGEFAVVVGQDLLQLLDVRVGEKVTVISPSAQVTPAGILPRLKRFRITAVYNTDMYEFDSGVVFIHMQDAQTFFRATAPTGLRLKTTDVMHAPFISREAVREIPGRYAVIDWTQRHVNYFLSLKMTKKMMFVILVLIVAVATFNIIATLIMVVTDKQGDIAVLRTMGASPGDVMRIFIVQGTIIGVTGIALGVAGGVLLSANIEALARSIERFFNIKFFTADVYYINELHADLHGSDVVIIALVAFMFTVLASLYPAWRAARTAPAEALRHE